MARLRRSVAKQGFPYWTQGGECPTSHLEPPSPDCATPTSAIDRPKVFSTFFALWPNKSLSAINEQPIETDKSKDEPIDIPKYLLSLPVLDYAHERFPKNTNSPRLPRHVPIIIPDFANPFGPESHCASAEIINSSYSLRSQSTPGPVTSVHALSSTPAAIEDTSSGGHAPVTGNSQTNMNNSQVSLSASESGYDHTPGSALIATPGSGVAISPVVSQQNAGPTNLSGLVCNVHRTTGQEPHALVGATTTILGDKLYVFGGRVHSRTKAHLTSDLYELDLIRRHWTKLETTGDIPPPRYFHSVCALGDSKLVCYGGMSPAPHLRTPPGTQSTKPTSEPQPDVVVMSDIHVFDMPSRHWTLISSSDNPQGRYAHCATILPSSAAFTSANAPLSAIHHNPPSSDPHSGTLGVQLDGTGGAEMVVVGGQDSANNYIEQISVFNLRSLKWTATTSWDRKCGAYKSMVAPMSGLAAERLGQGVSLDDRQAQLRSHGTSMLIYSNYNFLDVKLELQIRLPDGGLVERPMAGPVSPPGLRFPNGGIIDNHFVVSGTYLTSSKHEYALWALDLRTLTWGRIDTAGTVFGQGSWNRGVLWNQRNTFVILGHRKRSLVDDYNHRRINFSHICMVELEAFGLYENPRRSSPTSGYKSVSAPAIPTTLQTALPSSSAGGRPYTSTAEQLGQAALNLMELSDMDLVAVGGEKIPCNSYMLSRRWGPFFNQLVQESASSYDSSSISDAATLRPSMHSQASRNSTVTITPAAASRASSIIGGASTELSDPGRSLSCSTTRTLVELTHPPTVPASSRPRALYLPHTVQTIQLLLHFLYTSSLPPVGTSSCTPHSLCSLLQMARPYQIDGLLEATVERLHEVLDGRNAAAVFNAAAMAAGGGRALGNHVGGTLAALERRESQSTTIGWSGKTARLKITTNFDNFEGRNRRSHAKADSIDSASTATSTSSTDFSQTDTESSTHDNDMKKDKETREIWTGGVSSVIGLQKRGLRGLMEGRRLRERANTIGTE